MNHYFTESKLLNYSSPCIKDLFRVRSWHVLDETIRAQKIYEFIRDKIKFGYNRKELIPASLLIISTNNSLYFLP